MTYAAPFAFSSVNGITTMDTPRSMVIEQSQCSGFQLIAGWITRRGAPSLRHAVMDPDDPESDMTTWCGRSVPIDAHLESAKISTPHRTDPMGLVCERCDMTKQALIGGNPKAAIYCIPTDCMLCRERMYVGFGWIQP